MTGQATTGLELVEQCSDLDAVFVAVGGGGLIGGIGSYMKQEQPRTKIVAAWPAAAQALNQCLEKGEIYEPSESETLSDGTAGGIEKDAITFPVCQSVIDHRVTVTEQQIKEAMKIFADKRGYLAPNHFWLGS